jgi:hypothetical protein
VAGLHGLDRGPLRPEKTRPNFVATGAADGRDRCPLPTGTSEARSLDGTASKWDT